MTIHPEFLGDPDSEAVAILSPETPDGPAPARAIEMVGASETSWSDATRQIADRAAKAFHHVTGLDVIRCSAAVRDGRITEYRVTAKVSFAVEPADIEAAIEP